MQQQLAERREVHIQPCKAAAVLGVDEGMPLHRRQPEQREVLSPAEWAGSEAGVGAKSQEARKIRR